MILTRTGRQQEMRRRTWALIRMSDVIFSHQVSLPSMISEDHCDTELPHNIMDDEFGPDCEELPLSRPASEATPVSYMVAKVKLYQELGNILQATSRVKNPVHYDEILRLDARLKKMKEELPAHLNVQPLERPHDPLSLIVARFNIHIPYLKITCLLHRQYMSRARHNPRYNYSRRSAIHASMEALRHLATLHRESQPDGRLRSLKWFVTSIATKDFLLPSMLIILDLHYDSGAGSSGAQAGVRAPSFWTREQRTEMISSLELTKEIWKGLANTSMEAVKAFNILELMLEKIKNPQTDQDVPIADAASARPDPFANFNPAEIQPEHTAAMTLGMLSGGMTPNTTDVFNAMQGSGEAKGAAPYQNLDPGATFSMDGPSFPPTFSADGLGMETNGDSPFSMLDNNMNLTSGFDWVSSDIMDSSRMPVSLSMYNIS